MARAAQTQTILIVDISEYSRDARSAAKISHDTRVLPRCAALRAKIGAFAKNENVTLRASPVRYSWVFLILLTSCGGGGGGGGDSAPNVPLPPATFYPNGAQVPVSGPDVPGVGPVDQGMTEFMRKWNVPG